MTSPATGKRRGNGFETDLVRWLREQGYMAERLPLTGARDEGDLYFYDAPRKLYVLIEAKAPGKDGKINLTGWLKELRVEVEHFAKARNLPTEQVHGYLVIKARSKPISEAFVVSTLTDLTTRHHH